MTTITLPSRTHCHWAQQIKRKRSFYFEQPLIKTVFIYQSPRLSLYLSYFLNHNQSIPLPCYFRCISGYFLQRHCTEWQPSALSKCNHQPSVITPVLHFFLFYYDFYDECYYTCTGATLTHFGWKIRLEVPAHTLTALSVFA